jgi:plasmid stability protein
MANLTISVEDSLLKAARMRALALGTSVNAVLREYLEAFAGVAPERSAAVADLLDLSRAAESRRGERSWTRDELHER